MEKGGSPQPKGVSGGPPQPHGLTELLRDPCRQPHAALRLADAAARRQPHARPERRLGPQQPQHAFQVGTGGSPSPGRPHFGVPGHRDGPTVTMTLICPP